MKRRLQIASFIAAFVATPVFADDSFLNEKLPATWVCYQSNEELLQVLRSVVPKPLVLPEGMSLPEGMPAKKPLVNPTEAEKTQAGSGALFGRVPGDKTSFTVRNYLGHAVVILGMTWRYDAGRDSVVLDFPWHVSDPRDNAALIETLSESTPPNDAKHVNSHTIDPNDAWRLAFNALLSKPENYPRAWNVRWKAEGILPGYGQPNNLFTGTILDESGTSYLLILNFGDDDGISLASPSKISFYLFTASGQLKHAGLFYAENGGGRQLRVEVGADPKRLIIHNGIDPNYNRYDQIFAVEKNRLIFKEGVPYGNLKAYYPPFKTLFEVSSD